MADQLLERADDLARIEGGLAAARRGHGSLVVVEGPAGIGKTSVLAATRAAAEEQGLRVLRARGAELEQEFAHGVVRQLLEPPLAAAEPDERADLLAGAAGLAAQRLRLPGAGADDPDADSQPDAAFAVLHGLYWLCANLAARRPLALAVDDAHWADASSLRFLAFLLTRLEELPVALVLALRPDEGGPGAELLAALAAEPAATLVRPAPLSAAAIAGLVEEGLGAAPDPAFAAACHEATRGTPFLVRQLVAALAEDGVPPSATAAALVERQGARSVRRWILLRLGRLPAAAARLARAVAVLETADLPDAAALAGLDPDEAGGAADRLAAASILEPGRPLAFIHPVVRAAVYGELSSGERSAAHRRAAELLVPTVGAGPRLAQHLLATDPAGDAWVVDRLTSAAADAASTGAPESAAVYLARALAEPPPVARRAPLLTALGLARISAGKPDAREPLEQAVAAAPPGPERVTAALPLARVLAREHRAADAVALLDGVAAELGEPDSELATRLEVGTLMHGVIDVATSPALRDRAAAMRARADAPDASRPLLAAGALVAMQRNEPAAVLAELGRRALAAGERPVPSPSDPPWWSVAVMSLLWAEDHAACAAALEAAIGHGRSTGDGHLLGVAFCHRAWLALRTGELEEAVADSRAALDMVGVVMANYEVHAAGLLAGALVESGDVEEAGRVIARVAGAIETPSSFGPVARCFRGRVRLAQRRPEEALADFLGAGAAADRMGTINPGYNPWRSLAATAHVALGQRAEAAELATAELELARAFGASRAVGVALRAAGVATEGPAGVALLREAVETLEGAGAPLELAYARTELGARLRRENRRAEARSILRLALDGAHRAGARPLAAWADTELRATGAKPRRVMLVGLESLTASERRVAELAAEGLTNREIAQTLFVTARTVEGHLTSVFRKLDLRSRDALPGALAQA